MSEPTAAPTAPSSGRLWAEQLAMGFGFLIALLVFMAFEHPQALSTAGEVLTLGHLTAYGWASLVGVVAQIILHEVGTLVTAHHFKLPLRIRFFPFGVNAAAILESQPRRAWIDAAVGLSGPLTGTLIAMICVLVYQFTDNPFFLGMACVGAFYNLFTLIPILDLEGGWIAPAVAPQAWLLGSVAIVLELTHEFNLVQLGVISFAVPRLLMLLRARIPREDLAPTGRQRILVSLTYFVLVLALGWFGSSSFEALSRLVPEAMGD